MKKALLASVLALTLTTPLQAQQAQCASRDRVITALSESWGESRQAIGLAGDQVIEIFANLETGTWTVTYTLPTGITCLVSSGTNYEATEEPLEPNL